MTDKGVDETRGEIEKRERKSERVLSGFTKTP
jgi:hypothetical protein